MNTLIRWNPLREMATMRNIMDRLFEERWLDESGMRLSPNLLALDVQEDDANYTVTTELPGVHPDHIQVKLDGETLMIEGEIPEQTVEQEGKRILVKERRYGKFSRSVRLPQPVNEGAVEAQYENGVLTLTLPKAEAAKPKLIPININNGKSS